MVLLKSEFKLLCNLEKCTFHKNARTKMYVYAFPIHNSSCNKRRLSSAPPAISAPGAGRKRKFGVKVSVYENSSGCKIGLPKTRFSGFDDVIMSKFSHFPAESTG